jgi:hypothetical protein
MRDQKGSQIIFDQVIKIIILFDFYSRFAKVLRCEKIKFYEK